MRIIIVVFILVLIPQQVFAYCYSLDPVTYNNCIQRENYINQMKQMQQQQIFMQNLQMEQQRQMHKHINIYIFFHTHRITLNTQKGTPYPSFVSVSYQLKNIFSQTWFRIFQVHVCFSQT